MSVSSHRLDRLATTFDHGGLVANAGLILAGTLMTRLGLLGLIKRWVRTGSANPGPKILTVVAAMVAGATHIDHVDMLRAGRTGAVLGFKPAAPSTVGTFLRSFTFGHVRQLEAVLSRALARAWQLGAGPGSDPLVVDLDSTICEVHGKHKAGAAYGYTKVLGYHPLLATRAGTSEVLAARMRKGSAGSSRGVLRFVDELVANLKRAGAAGPLTVRADAGFWSRKLINRLDVHNVKWSITVPLNSAVDSAIQAIPGKAWGRPRTGGVGWLWVASDFARRVLSFFKQHRAGLAVPNGEAAAYGFCATKTQDVVDSRAEVRLVGADAERSDHSGPGSRGGWCGPVGDQSAASCRTRRGGRGFGFVEAGPAPSVAGRSDRGRSVASGGGAVGAHCGRTSRRVGGAAGKNGLGMSGPVPARVDGTAKTALLDLIDDAATAGWTLNRVCVVLGLDRRRAWRWTQRRAQKGLSMMPAQADVGSTVCWVGNATRSWGCSTNGATLTGRTANSRTAAPIWAGCGCHPRRWTVF